MLKIKSLFVSCLLFISLFFLYACTATSKQNLGPDSTQIETKQLPAQKKKASPPDCIQVIQSPYHIRVVLYNDLCFQYNAQLTPTCARQLLRAMHTMKQYGNGLVQVVGYSDDIYDSQTANALSQQQANTVVSFLWAHGIETGRLQATGFGKHDPIASQRSLKGSAANRRVEITLVK